MKWRIDRRWIKQNCYNVLYAKNNELESLKKYVTDETTKLIITAKQDTLHDIEEFVKSEFGFH
jgi:hypothetical protein